MLSIRPVRFEDELLLFEWANDSLVRYNSINTALISLQCHQEWFQEKMLQKKSCRMYVLESTQEPMGQIRFEYRSPHWWLNYSLAAKFRGRGLGKTLVEMGIQQLVQDVGIVSVRAVVKPENKASYKICQDFGILSPSL